MAKTTTSPKQAPTQKTPPSVRKAPPPAARKAPRALPPALVANARALREAAQGRLKARGEAAVEIIKEKLTDISEHVLDIGMAARELMVTGVPEAMGHANFDALCAAELGLHPKTLQRWATLATRLKRQFVLSVGVGRAEALMELCDATPADDVPEDLVDATLVLPSGAKLVVKDDYSGVVDDYSGVVDSYSGAVESADALPGRGGGQGVGACAARVNGRSASG